MPELPEVEVVRRGLLPHVLGARITRASVHDIRSVRHQVGGPQALLAGLAGRTIDALARRGKFLWWRLCEPDGTPSPQALVTHLGMSGQLRVRAHSAAAMPTTDGAAPAAPAPFEGPAPDPVRHLRIRLDLQHADGRSAAVDFVDQRIFGGMHLSRLEGEPDGPAAGEGSPDGLLPAAAAHIARDVLDPHLDLAGTVEVLGRRTAPIKALLLDQRVISGIGNIYADEALWAARVRYDAPAGALSRRRLTTVLEETASVMRRALAVGGTSFDALYVNVDGRSGYFARSLAVYGREGEPCPRCGAPIRRRTHRGRSSHVCMRCQRRR